MAAQRSAGTIWMRSAFQRSLRLRADIQIGPEYPFAEPVYDPDEPFPGALLAEMDAEVRPFANAARPPKPLSST